jgi:pimeloyl-ACP methyl ester carboxylesterase
MSRPDLVRSWVSDVIGLFDPDYVWHGKRAAQRPGLALLATEDYVVVGTNQQRRHSAQRAGARTETLEGLGHWWMTQDPERGARVLIDFWASLDR